MNSTYCFRRLNFTVVDILLFMFVVIAAGFIWSRSRLDFIQLLILFSGSVAFIMLCVRWAINYEPTENMTEMRELVLYLKKVRHLQELHDNASKKTTDQPVVTGYVLAEGLACFIKTSQEDKSYTIYASQRQWRAATLLMDKLNRENGSDRWSIERQPEKEGGSISAGLSYPA